MAYSIVFTHNDGTYTHRLPVYQCEFNSNIGLSPDKSDIVIYLTKKDPITRTSEVEVLSPSTEYLFEEGCLYFVRVEDTSGTELVEYTRVYQTGHMPHANYYGICESSKCKVNLNKEHFLFINKENPIKSGSYSTPIHVPGLSDYNVLLAIFSDWQDVGCSFNVILSHVEKRYTGYYFEGNGVVNRDDGTRSGKSEFSNVHVALQTSGLRTDYIKYALIDAPWSGMSIDTIIGIC